MARYVVVTGTDTDVGKTFVTEALARRWSRTRTVVAIKPFESGAREGEGDGERLAAATGQRTPVHAIVRLRDPLAPAMAADREGHVIDWDTSIAVMKAHGKADVVLVEGAGGILSPLTWEHDVLHIARALDAAVLLVGSDRLGTLSTTHTAVHVARDRGALPRAIVLSEPSARDASTGLNADALRRRLGAFGDVSERVLALPRTDVNGAVERLAPLDDWLLR